MAEKLVLVRHGETLWSASGKHTGLTDIPLTDKGKEEAQRLAPFLQKMSFQKAFVSPLLRARATFDLLHLSIEEEIDPDLREWNYGELEGKTSKEIKAENPSWSIFTHGSLQGESPQDVEQRALRVLAKVEALEGTILLVSSGHFLRSLAAKWLKQPLTFGAQIPLSTASISVLGYEHSNPCLSLWNGQIPLV